MYYKLLIAAGSLFFSVLAQAQPVGGGFSLMGKVEDHKTGAVLHISYTGKGGKRVTDSIASADGSFSFKGEIDEPVIARFYGILSRRENDPNSVDLFLEPSAMVLKIKRDRFSEASLTGSVTNNEYAPYQRQLFKIRNRWSNVMDTLSAINRRSNFEYQAVKNWVLVPYNKETDELVSSFLRQHPRSYATAYLLRFHGRELHTDTLKKLYANFPRQVQLSSYGISVRGEIEKRKTGVPGAVAADFQAMDINGVEVRLADYKGKYVLLDFWASWCLPCRQLNPHLKELYAEYKDRGFEVIGISDDDRNPAAWKEAVAQDGLPWKHVLRGVKSQGGVRDVSNDINARYNISTLPTHILIDRTGKIVARYGGGGEDNMDVGVKLKELLN